MRLSILSFFWPLHTVQDVTQIAAGAKYKHDERDTEVTILVLIFKTGKKNIIKRRQIIGSGMKIPLLHSNLWVSQPGIFRKNIFSRDIFQWAIFGLHFRYFFVRIQIFLIACHIADHIEIETSPNFLFILVVFLSHPKETKEKSLCKKRKEKLPLVFQEEKEHTIRPNQEKTIQFFHFAKNETKFLLLLKGRNFHCYLWQGRE